MDIPWRLSSLLLFHQDSQRCESVDEIYAKWKTYLRLISPAHLHMDVFLFSQLSQLRHKLHVAAQREPRSYDRSHQGTLQHAIFINAFFLFVFDEKKNQQNPNVQVSDIVYHLSARWNRLIGALAVSVLSGAIHVDFSYQTSLSKLSSLLSQDQGRVCVYRCEVAGCCGAHCQSPFLSFKLNRWKSSSRKSFDRIFNLL